MHFSSAIERHSPLFYGGAFQKPSGTIRRLTNPATEEAFAEVHDAHVDDVGRAAESAAAAFPDWSARALDERIAFVTRILEACRRRTEGIAQTITAEMGAPISYARPAMAEFPVRVVENAIEVARAFHGSSPRRIFAKTLSGSWAP